MKRGQKAVILLKATVARDGRSCLDGHISFWLHFVSNHVSGVFAKLVEMRGVSVSEWLVLRCLNDAPASPSDLADALGMTRHALLSIVSRLGDKGLAERVTDPPEGRAGRVHLTDRGRTLVPELVQLADQNDAAFFGHLPLASQKDIVRLMKDVVRAHGLKTVPMD